MRGKFALVCFLVLFGLVFGQYELRESYYGAGGPVGASGGDYNLWGSALGQTAVTVISGGSYEDQQGFYHKEKMFLVIFRARDAIRAAIGDPDSLTVWHDSIMVRVWYRYRGVWRCDSIGKGDVDSIVAWVDTVQAGEYNYCYGMVAINNCTNPELVSSIHRWARPDSAWGTVTEGTQSDPETVIVDFWEQFKSQNPIVFDPPTGTPCPGGGCDGGWVDYVKFSKFGGDSTRDADLYEHGSTVEIWADKGCKFEFSDTTTAGWITISDHIFDPYSKSTSNTIKYQQPLYATYANGILWRRYSLFGVPVYPREDTAAYRAYATSHGCISGTEELGFGEQDIVLYDDLDPECDVPANDSTCGMWENWYRIMRYYPDTLSGGYRRYQGPGAPNNPDRFAPGYGFWGNQIHCDSIPFDVFGVTVDTTTGFEVALDKYERDLSSVLGYTKYNMLANPFYITGDADTLVVPAKWQVKRVASDTPGRGIKTLSAPAAIDSGWIESHIVVYRRAPGTSVFQPVNIPLFETTPDSAIHTWEGFWFNLGDTALKYGDSLHLIMWTENHSPVMLLCRRTPDVSWYVDLSCSAGEEVDLHNLAGYSPDPRRNFEEMPPFTYPPDRQDPLRLYYVVEGRKLCNAFFAKEQSHYTWTVHLEPGCAAEEHIRLFWDLSHLPTDYVAILKVPGVGSVDMRQQGYVLLPPTHGKALEMQLYVYHIASPIAEGEEHLPDRFFLSPSVPNPFNLSTSIRFGIPAGGAGHTVVAIYDQLGRRIRTLWDRDTQPGYYTVVWDGTDDEGKPVSAGVYFCRIIHPQFTATRRAVLVK